MVPLLLVRGLKLVIHEHPGTPPRDRGEKQQGELEFGPAYKLEQREQAYILEKGLVVVVLPLQFVRKVQT